MKHNATQLSLFAAALALVAGCAYNSANACGKCAGHNAVAEQADNRSNPDDAEGFTTILGKGHTDGWTLNDDWMKIEDGILIAGSYGKNEGKKVPKTMYAVHDKTYYNFELRADIKVVGPEKSNAGFQIRSSYDEEKATMAGYQADVGEKYWGRLYDQSRGRGLLGQYEEGIDLAKDINWNEWNSYVVRCEGPRIRIWINGKLFTDYTEKTEKFIGVKGRLGLQLHWGPPSVRYHRNIRIKELDD